MKVEVMGPGCPKCETMEKNARQALAKLGLEAELEHIYDVREYARRGVILTPALAVDGEVKLSGHVASVDEIVSVLASAQSPSP
jgi:small redox-active disulfide protein 2